MRETTDELLLVIAGSEYQIPVVRQLMERVENIHLIRHGVSWSRELAGEEGNVYVDKSMLILQ